MKILQDALLVQFQPASVQEHVDIVIDGSTIHDVGHKLGSKYPDADVTMLNGAMVTPGIVCSHNHFYSGLARGILADIAVCPDFVSTLQNLWWKLDRALDRESLYSSAMICVLEAIKAGNTAVIDHHASPACIQGSLTVLKECYEKAGLRGILCYETTDRNGKEGMREGLAENIEFAKCIDAEQAEGKRYLLEAAVGGHAPFTLDDEALTMLAEAVKSTGRGFHVHIAEDRYDASYSRHIYGKNLLPRLEAFGLVNEKSLFAHCVHLEDSDIETINHYDAFVLHNARSNMNNAIGYAEKLSSFHNVALGTDGIGANMFEEMKTAYFKHKDAGGPYWPGDFLGFLYNGNVILERYFGKKFGRVEKGYQADLTIYDYDMPTPLTADNIGGHFVFGMASRDVNSVMVDGEFVYKDRRFPFDLAPIYEKARQEAQRVWDRMDTLD
ncbi:chlorohydrolase [candidate division KSB3 bacterium]|uniref:Chlorohydrolase n=1 Tax=candidate division KSB3 bacterium TaxID=2044937 RepID=A0A2G6EBG1_9BACT|nr:MAG: chlorohydrolase [candidate division KSB3 bacterium]PIE30717.1 MAG: chlorohydrolase [candidate division KSB3 bacterium]